MKQLLRSVPVAFVEPSLSFCALVLADVPSRILVVVRVLKETDCFDLLCIVMYIVMEPNDGNAVI